MRIIKAENMETLQDVELLLNSLKPINEFLDTIDENEFEYELICENVQEQFCEILEFLKLSTMKFTQTNLAICDFMNMVLWDYLKGEYTFKELINELNRQYKTREV